MRPACMAVEGVTAEYICCISEIALSQNRAGRKLRWARVFCI